jgi:Glycine rich protein
MMFLVRFAYTGSAQYFTVLANVYSIHVNVTGAAGGSDYSSSSAPYFAGGLGGMVSADLSVTPGTTLCIYVGELLHFGSSASESSSSL